MDMHRLVYTYKNNKVNRTKISPLIKISKTDKILAELTKLKKRKNLLKIWKSGVRENHYQHYRNKKDYQAILGVTICQQIRQLGEMDKFLEIHKLLKLTEEEIENLNKRITRDRSSYFKTSHK